MWPEKQGLICKRIRTCPGRNQNLFLLLKRVSIIPPYEGKCFFHCNKWIPLLVLNGSVNILLSLLEYVLKEVSFLGIFHSVTCFLRFNLQVRWRDILTKYFWLGTLLYLIYVVLLIWRTGASLMINLFSNTAPWIHQLRLHQPRLVLPSTEMISVDLLIVSDFNRTFMKLGFHLHKMGDSESHPVHPWIKSRYSLIEDTIGWAFLIPQDFLSLSWLK